MSFARAIATVGGLTLISRVFGFARDILTAAILGAGPGADAFFVALKLPNFFRRLFAEGAFSVSFVPLFAARLEDSGRVAAQTFAAEALAAMLAVMLPFTVLMIVAMPWLMVVLAPGFADQPEKFALAIDLARCAFPYLALISVTALLGGVLNAMGRFAAFAAAPIAFNVTLIASLGLAAVTGWRPTYALAHGVAAAGVTQLLWLYWACRRAGVRLPLVRPRLTPTVVRLLRLMGPGAIGTGIMQVNLFVNIVLASLLPTGAVSYLYYADRLYQLPLGVIGIAIGTTLLPLLSRHAAAGNQGAVRHYVGRALEFSLVLGVPAAVALAVASAPIISVLFQRGAFGTVETAATAAALAGYAAGIPAYLIAKVLSTIHYAHQDTATPVKLAGVAAIANAALALALMPWLGHVGIAAATALAAWLNAALLAAGLARRGALALDPRLLRRAPRIVLAGVGMGGLVHLAGLALAPWVGAPGAGRFAALALTVTLGLAGYFALATATGGLRPAELRELIRRPPAPVD
ncbi:MAG: murein biosynthesis integral membrane protein MurJ [Azospirillum sp.]|nr:murein biosynthesis integral membrane protein MurJ [Azospirillum sp.]